MKTIQTTWDNDYPDVPWYGQDLFVPVLEDIRSDTFEFLFENVSKLPQIELVWRSTEESAAPGRGQFEIKPASDGFGLILKTLDSDSSEFRGFRIRQQGVITQGRAALIQYDRTHGDWVVVYNTLDRVRELQKTLANPLYVCGNGELVVLVDLLLKQQSKLAGQLIDSRPDLQSLLKNHEWLTDRFRLTYTSHGLKKTFKHWSLPEIQTYLNEALDIVHALKGLSPNVCLFGGVALGWQRQRAVLDHDDDLDILIALEKDVYHDIGAALERVAMVLQTAGWKITGKFFNHLWVKTRSSAAETLDVFIGLIEDDRVSCYTLPRKGLDFQRMFPALEYPLHELSVPLPRDMEHYLEVNFGASWRVPDPGFQSNWDRRRYADIAGKRSYIPMMTRGEVAFAQRLSRDGDHMQLQGNRLDAAIQITEQVGELPLGLPARSAQGVETVPKLPSEAYHADHAPIST